MGLLVARLWMMARSLPELEQMCKDPSGKTLVSTDCRYNAASQGLVRVYH